MKTKVILIRAEISIEIYGKLKKLGYSVEDIRDIILDEGISQLEYKVNEDVSETGHGTLTK